MNRTFGIAAAIALATFLVGCASEREPVEVPLLRNPAYSCPGFMADSQGGLTGHFWTHPKYGVVLITPLSLGNHLVLYWPEGFTAQRIGDEVAILRPDGQLFALTTDAPPAEQVIPEDVTFKAWRLREQSVPEPGRTYLVCE